MKTLRNIVLALAATLAGCGGSGSSTGTRFVPVQEKVVLGSYVSHRDDTYLLRDRSADNTDATLAVNPVTGAKAELIPAAAAKDYGFWGMSADGVAFSHRKNPTATADVVVKDANGTTVFHSNSPTLDEHVIDTRGPVIFQEYTPQIWAPKIKMVVPNGAINLFPLHDRAYVASQFQGQDALVIAQKNGIRDHLFAIDSRGQPQSIFDLNQRMNAYGFFFPTTGKDLVTVSQPGPQGTEFAFIDLRTGRESVVPNPFTGWGSIPSVSFDGKQALFYGTQAGTTTADFVRVDISGPQGRVDPPMDFSRFSGWQPNYVSLGTQGSALVDGRQPYPRAFPSTLMYRSGTGVTDEWPALIPSGSTLDSDRITNEYDGQAILNFRLQDANGNYQESIARFTGARLAHQEVADPVTGNVTAFPLFDYVSTSNQSHTSSRFAFIQAERKAPGQIGPQRNLYFFDMTRPAVQVDTSEGWRYTGQVFSPDDSRVAFGLAEESTGRYPVYVADPRTLGSSVTQTPRDVGGRMDPFLELSLDDRIIAIGKRVLLVAQGTELMAYDLNTGDRTRISVGQQ